MKKESNIISTKDELVKNFSKEQMDIYNYYKSKFSYANEELYPVVKEDKEMLVLENTYKVLKKIFKAEVIASLIIVTFVFIFNGAPKSETQYRKAVSAQTVEDIENR